MSSPEIEAAEAPIILDYQIINPYKNFGEGDINSIATPRGYWKSLIGADKIVVRCGLRNYCRVVSMEARVLDVHLIEVIGYHDDKWKFEEMKLVGAKERNGEQVLKHVFSAVRVVDQLQMEMSSFSKKQLGIFFFTFRGYVSASKCLPQEGKKHLAQPTLPRPSLAVDDAIIQDLASNKFGHYRINKKTIADEMLLKNRLKSNEPLFMRTPCDEGKLIEDVEINEFENGQPNYKVIRIQQEQLGLFRGVSQKWLAAQKRFQFQAGVKTFHQLSIKIEPRCFKDQVFCIANIHGAQKAALVRMVRELGGVARDEPEEGCIVVTCSMKGAAVGIARLMKNVSFVQPEYIEDCAAHKSRLDQKKYRLKVDQNMLYQMGV